MATSQIVNAINSLLDRLAAIPFDWSSYLNEKSGGLYAGTDMPDNTKLLQSLAVWNNQVRQWKNGKGMPTTKPNAYVQVIPGKPTTLTQGVKLYQDFVFKVHLIDWQADGYNEAGGLAGNNERIGGNDQNLEIFTMRDMVISQLQNFFPLQCSAMTIVDEEVDDEHTDIIHHILSFKTSFTDLQGSTYNPDVTGNYVDPPNGKFGFAPTVNFTAKLNGRQVKIVSQAGNPYQTQGNSYYVTQKTC